MSDIRYQLKKRLFRLKTSRRRRWKRRSAFARDLFRNVLDAKLHYYAFGELQKTRQLAIKLLKSSCKSPAVSHQRANDLKEEILNLKRGKDTDRLVFRLMNHFKSTNPIFIGSGLSYSKAYMAKVDSRLTINCIGDCLKNEEINSEIFNHQLGIKNIKIASFRDITNADFVVISNLVAQEDILFFTEKYEKILGSKCTIVLLNMRKNSELMQLWRQLQTNQEFKICIDMFSAGILIADQDLQKQEYIRKISI
ncbi:hypothetical protein [Marinifilum caeruleilacunae]|uniref:SAM-dependent methyltransferase n=1 Tax=Marinifilum caeruleilacunae TaxID=2499076 RepID=A0ABX1WTJ9_9BACT|nr:hypothetical protein [Marinifilum caeruleilacunae]NOU59424.1 hypothetical protein [Marinifilum caeruleilacunae]